MLHSMSSGVTAPARLGTIRLPDGRSLGWAEWGPSAATPVLLCSGAATSRWLGFGADVLDTLPVRLISVDRPGLGSSSPLSGRGFCFQVRADERNQVSFPAQLQNGMVLEMSYPGHIVSVRRADVEAPLVRVPVFEAYMNRQGTELELSIDYCFYFGEPLVERFTLNMLEARLANARALKLHRAKRFAEAAPEFRKALQFDSKFFLAALNLASALTLDGKKEAAMAALAPFLRLNFLRVYMAIQRDLELQPLLDTPEIRALQADVPGTGVLQKRDSSWLAYSAKHNLLAALDQHSGLVFFSLKSGELVAQLDMGSEVLHVSCDGDCDLSQDQRKQNTIAQAEFVRQLPTANRLLSSLGFNAVAPREEGTETCPASAQEEAKHWRALCLKRSGLVFSLSETAVKVRGGNKDMTWEEDENTGHISALTYLPQLGAFVYKWTKDHGSAECGRLGGTAMVLVSKGKKASRTRPETPK